MGQPAARLTDMHVCPMLTPGLPPIPHVGGPITGPGVPNVLIGGMPAATIGDMCVCVGPPDAIIKGSAGVLIGGKSAARMGDSCAHGGTIILGCPTVLIGDAGGGGGGGGCGGGAGGAAGGGAAAPWAPASPPPSIHPVAMEALKVVIESLPPVQAAALAQQVTLMLAADAGTPFCEVCAQQGPTQ